MSVRKRDEPIIVRCFIAIFGADRKHLVLSSIPRRRD